jgi:cation:H+ antiporter
VTILEFVLAAAVTLSFSVLLVMRLERVGARLGFTSAILGLVTALAANAPEMTSAITALARGQNEVGVGVVLGSNVFNLAALLGLGSLVAGRIDLHRRVIVLIGGASLAIALVSLATVTTTFSATTSLVLVLAIFAPYVVLSAWPHALRHLGVPRRPRRWVREAIREEEAEIAEAIHARAGDWRDVSLAGVALVVVVVASIVMEHTASSMGRELGWSNIVIGGVVLAGVTSLPNAVAAVYFASRGRGSVVLSEALNSNNLNTLFGFLAPAAVLGLQKPTTSDLIVDVFYLGLSAVALALTYAQRGLRRPSGSIIILGYLVFVVVLASR